MKNAARRVFSCKIRCRYSRKRATSCRNFADRPSCPITVAPAAARGAPAADAAGDDEAGDDAAAYGGSDFWPRTQNDELLMDLSARLKSKR